jgi:hypothetical protein
MRGIRGAEVAAGKAKGVSGESSKGYGQSFQSCHGSFHGCVQEHTAVMIIAA